MDEARLTRRGSLIGFGGLLLGLLGWKTSSAGAGPSAVESGAVTCVLSPEQTEGPYYIDGEKLRRDITEGRPGVPLLLRLRVVDASTCKPIKGAAVDIWHCDALGIYSGFGSGSGNRTFMRGHPEDRRHRPRRASARSSPAGTRAARCTSTSRCTSAARSSTPASSTSPTRSPTRSSDRKPYSRRGKRTTRNANDFVFAQGGKRSLLSVRKSGSAYVASITMGVHR